MNGEETTLNKLIGFCFTWRRPTAIDRFLRRRSLYGVFRSKAFVRLTILKARSSRAVSFATFASERFFPEFLLAARKNRTFLAELPIVTETGLFLNKYYDTHFELNYRVTLSVSRPNRHTSRVELLIAALLAAATRIPLTTTTTTILSVINGHPKVIP